LAARILDCNRSFVEAKKAKICNQSLKNNEKGNNSVMIDNPFLGDPKFSEFSKIFGLPQPPTAGETPDTALNLGNLSRNRTVGGFVGDAEPFDFYRFSIDGLSNFVLNMNNLSADADVYLYQDANNNDDVEVDELIGSSENAGTEAEQLDILVNPGSYIVSVEQFEGDTNYRLNLQATRLNDPPDRAGNTLGNARDLGILGVDVRLSDFVGTADTNDCYRFTIDRDSRFGAYLTGLAADADIELIQDTNNNGLVEDNEVLDFSEGGGTEAEYLSVGRLASGTYYARVSQFEGNTAYQLGLFADPDSAIAQEVFRTISGNQTIQETLESGDSDNPDRVGSFADEYLLTDVRAGQEVTVNLNSSEFDTYIQVVNIITNELIVENDDVSDDNTNSRLTFTVQPDAEYAIRVTSFDQDAEGVGNYTLTTSASSPIVGAIAPDQTINGTLTITDLRNAGDEGSFSDDYQLNGINAGQQVQINLNSDQFDTYLQLVNAATGQVISFNDDANPDTINSQLTFTAAAGVQYVVRVSSYENAVTGNYTLGVTSVVAPLPPPPSNVSEFINRNFNDPGLRNLTLNLVTDGSLNRNDLLSLFDNSVGSDRIFTADELSDFKLIVNNSTLFNTPDSVRYLTNRVIQDASPNLGADQFQSIVGRWLRGTEAPTPIFDQDERTDTGEPAKQFQLQYAVVQGPLFGNVGQARIGGINQGQLGNCAFLAALGATFGPQLNDAGNQASAIINNMIIDNGDNTYTVRFYNDRTLQAQYVTVDRRVALATVSDPDAGIETGNIFGARPFGTLLPSNPANNPIWVPIVERAYAQYRQDPNQTGQPGYNAIGQGDNVTDPLTRVTGRRATSFFTTNITFEQIQTALAGGQFIEVGTPEGVQKATEGLIVDTHAYSLTNAYVTQSGEQRIVVRNPWGQDGYQSRDGRNDGFLDLSFEEFKTYFEDLGIA
jgi:Calpain family cysteine protease